MQEMWHCDECGEPFEYPNEGGVYAGFGICNKCKEKIDNE